MASQRSLGPILDEVRHERSTQLDHFNALDSKAGIVLGFAGALIALAPSRAGWLVDVARLAAVFAAGFALVAFWPRSHGVVNLRNLRSKYLSSDPAFTSIRLLDSHVEMFEASLKILAWKSRWVKGAMSALGVSAALAAAGFVVG